MRPSAVFSVAMLSLSSVSVALISCSRVNPLSPKETETGESVQGVLGPRLWSQPFGDPDPQFGRAITVDSDGNVIITGEFHGTVNFGCGDLASPGASFFPDIYVAKFSSSGTCLWSLQFNSSADGWPVAGAAIADLPLV